MIKVICIHSPRSRPARDTEHYKPLTVGKIYDAQNATDNSYIINGWWENKRDFIIIRI